MSGERLGKNDKQLRDERRQQLAAQGWSLVGRDPDTGAWRFLGPEDRQLLVPSREQDEAMRVLLRQLQGEALVPESEE